MFKRLLLLSGFAVALAVAGLWASSPRETEAHTWAPFFGPPDFYTLDPTTPAANSDIRTQYNVFTPSANFSGLFGRAITFGDKDVTQSSAAQIPGPGNNCGATPCPVGAYIGSLTTVPILGLANEGCNSGAVTFVFNFVDANVDVTPLPIDTPPGDGSPTTSNDPLFYTGAIPAAADDALTIITFAGASGTNPLGVRVTDRLPINEIELDGDGPGGNAPEQMQIVDAPVAANGTLPAGQYQVRRGWNGTTPVAHADATDALSEILKVNVIFPSGPASQLLANMAEDDGNFDNTGSAEFADFGSNDVADAADAGAPSFVRDSMDPDGDADNGGYIQPHARYYSTLLIANSLIVLLQFVLQNNGVLAANNFQNLGWADTNWGYSSTTFLQDPLAPPSNSAISDFCNFSSNTRFFGVTHDNQCTDTIALPAACTTVTPDGFTMRLAVDNGGPVAGVGTCAGTVPAPTVPNECGSVRQTNPATAQVVRYYQYGVTQRDLDNDGHMNALDTCDQVANPNWDPRAFNGLSGADGDADGLPTACDPNDASANNDQDGDGWQNRLDNCPNTANAAPGGGGGTAPNSFQYDQDVDPGRPEVDIVSSSVEAGTFTVITTATPHGYVAGNRVTITGHTGSTPNINGHQTIASGGGLPPVTATTFPIQVDVTVGGTGGTLSATNHVSDGGPSTDSIGVACDPAANVANGHYHAAYASQTICIGVIVITPNQHPDDCSSTLDADLDGVVNARDTCLFVNSSVTLNPGSHPNPPKTFPGPNGQDTITAQVDGDTITVGSAAGFVQGSPIVIGRTRNIASSSVANPTVITTTAAHGFTTGQTVTIAGHAGSTPNINNSYPITVTGATTFTIPVNVTAGGAGGTATVSAHETLRYITAISGTTIDFTPAIAPASHSAGDPVAQVSYSQPIFDLNNSGFVDSGDMALITDKIGANGGAGVATPQYLPGAPSGTGPGVQYQARLDINDGLAPDNIIDTGDQGKIGGATGIRCGPVP